MRSSQSDQKLTVSFETRALDGKDEWEKKRTKKIEAEKIPLRVRATCTFRRVHISNDHLDNTIINKASETHTAKEMKQMVHHMCVWECIKHQVCPFHRKPDRVVWQWHE